MDPSSRDGEQRRGHWKCFIVESTLETTFSGRGGRSRFHLFLKGDLPSSIPLSVCHRVKTRQLVNVKRKWTHIETMLVFFPH